MNKCYTALITPFTIMNDIDYAALDRLIEKLIDEGCDGFMVCGTTAETSALNENEKISLLEHVIAATDKRAEIYFGIGTASTCESMRLLKITEDMDFEGYLIVTPYYNQPTQYGLYEHFSALAAETVKKIILYHVPKRCGVAMTSRTIIQLANDYPNIIALKQACRDLDQVKEVLANTKDFLIYSGQDDYLLEGMQAGMSGVVSVIGHLYMKELKAFMHAFEQQEDCTESDRLFKQISSLLFAESNPIGIKYLCSKKGFCLNTLRLPMTPISEEAQKRIDEQLK